MGCFKGGSEKIGCLRLLPMAGACIALLTSTNQTEQGPMLERPVVCPMWLRTIALAVAGIYPNYIYLYLTTLYWYYTNRTHLRVPFNIIIPKKAISD